MMQQKSIALVMVMAGVVVLSSHDSLAQPGVLQGTETPAVYGNRDRILARQDRLERRQTEKLAARIYRNMVAAYKAGRRAYFDEQSAELSRLLDDSRLSEAYAEKMRIKYRLFLAKVERGQAKTGLKPMGDGNAAVQDSEKSLTDWGTASALFPAQGTAKSQSPVRDQAGTLLSEEERQRRQADKLLAYQKNMLELERAEVDRYVHLYQKELTETRRQMTEEFNAKIESLYQDGLEYFDQKAYHFAFDVLKAVEQLKPDYKLTRRYLEDLQRYFQSKTP